MRFMDAPEKSVSDPNKPLALTLYYERGQAIS